MSEEEVYRRLIEWLKQGWWDLPEADELMPLMKARCTPEEAELLTGMSFSGRYLEELAELKRINKDELREKMDALARKGVVFRTVREDSVRYSLNDSMFTFLRASFWHGREDTDTKKIAPLVNQYFYHGFFDQYGMTDLKELRALPIGETIEDTREILPYEEVAKVLDSKDYFAVSICPCKHRKNIDPDSPNCSYPTEVCLHFDRLGRYTVENGMGREITRQEAEEILRQSAEVGLVHGISNYQEGVDTICNCDPCCCIWFEAFHKLKHAKSMDASNYRVRTNPETCIGDGMCVKRCHMEALRLEDSPEVKGRVTVMAAENKSGKKELKNKTGKVAVLNPDICIGCGVCAYKCPTKSLVLERREVIQHPPETPREYVLRTAADFVAARSEGEQKE